MSRISALGKKRFAAQACMAVLSIAVIALAMRVNQYQDYFFMADRAPLFLGAITLSCYIILFAFDICTENVFLARAPFLLTFELMLAILWLAANTFSTARWSHIPTKCSAIPASYSAERSWCRNVQGLKSVVWLTFVFLFITWALTLRTALFQHKRGQAHIWRAPLSRFRPRAQRSSEFLQYPFPGNTGGAGHSTSSTPLPGVQPTSSVLAGLPAPGTSRQQKKSSYFFFSGGGDREGGFGRGWGVRAPGSGAERVQREREEAAWVGFEPVSIYGTMNNGGGARISQGSSVPGGPGLAGVGAAPANWGGFERM